MLIKHGLTVKLMVETNNLISRVHSNPTRPCLSRSLETSGGEPWGQVWEANNIWPLIS